MSDGFAGQAAPTSSVADPQAAAVEAFFKPAPLRRAALSPSGRWLAVLSALPGRRMGFLISDVQDPQRPPHFIEASDTDDVVSFEWKGDEWLLFSVRDVRDQRDARLPGGLLATRRDGSSSWAVIPRGRYGSRLLHTGPRDGPEIILGEGHFDGGGEHKHTTLRAVNLETRKSRIVQDDAPRASEWWFDAEGRARASTDTEGRQTVTRWAGADGVWREIDRSDFLTPRLAPAFVDGERLFVYTWDASGSMEVRAFDDATGQPSPDVLVSTPGFDEGVTVLRRQGRIAGVRYVTDAEGTHWFDPDLQALQDRADARWPGRINRLSVRKDVTLVTSHRDTDPGKLLLWRPADDRWQLLGSLGPDVGDRQMAPVAFHRIRARDGQELPLWVTGVPPKGAAPRAAVVHVHGGPHLRGHTWSWDAAAQFLASRGYVVIQPEFRGSVGYGRRHFVNGWKQWGTGMIDDITDALGFAVKQGWVDERRVCIMGSSYGGYAALMSLVREPRRYRCGVAHAALSDPRHNFDFHWSDFSRAVLKDFFPLVLGDPKQDAALFDAGSPLKHASRIEADVLLLHGGRDYRVPLENGERMRDALKKLGRPVEWVEYEREGHGFAQEGNLLDFWRRIDAFLALRLQPPSATADPAAPSNPASSQQAVVMEKRQ